MLFHDIGLFKALASTEYWSCLAGHVLLSLLRSLVFSLIGQIYPPRDRITPLPINYATQTGTYVQLDWSKFLRCIEFVFVLFCLLTVFRHTSWPTKSTLTENSVTSQISAHSSAKLNTFNFNQPEKKTCKQNNTTSFLYSENGCKKISSSQLKTKFV